MILKTIGGYMKKLGFAIISLVWVFSLASNAGGVVIAAGPCVHLHSPGACANYPTGECFWDYADQRCENRNNTEDRCSSIYSPSRCINSPYGCFWDYDDQRCERQN